MAFRSLARYDGIGIWAVYDPPKKEHGAIRSEGIYAATQCVFSRHALHHAAALATSDTGNFYYSLFESATGPDERDSEEGRGNACPSLSRTYVGKDAPAIFAS